MWLIEKTDGVIFDEKKHELRTDEGEYLASVGINQFGLLEIWLGMNTNFTSDDGKIHALGWNGCEEHMGDIVNLKHGGGILEYQEDRTSIFRKAGKIINIKIVRLKGNLVPVRQYSEPQPKSWFREFLASIRETFAQRQNSS